MNSKVFLSGPFAPKLSLSETWRYSLLHITAKMEEHSLPVSHFYKRLFKVIKKSHLLSSLMIDNTVSGPLCRQLPPFFCALIFPLQCHYLLLYLLFLFRFSETLSSWKLGGRLCGTSSCGTESLAAVLPSFPESFASPLLPFILLFFCSC